ncbi:nucleotidyltransferase [Salinisphaera sp.]|uniref:nucleotidyltransferase domain-containing protein n=1 Tax=Salinisphaera sp. TaxID=1914330 RepID=UPI002D7A320A|nr:nucleotidyltransferase [Salinisphaera sp.]HET7313935.1 nucleotidyltransferase [Salinisphaera sp.]
MSLEEQLTRWTSPSSDTEQDKQERTERMIRQAVDAHTTFNNCDLKIYAKGSYANNTNVRADSDVDIAVECTEVLYWEEAEQGLHPPGNKYEGVWTPTKLRSELLASLKAKFGENVDSSGSTAIQINSGSSRVDADVVPCFSYKYYLQNEVRPGTKIFKTDGSSLVNYPVQQLDYGIAKNKRTGYSYKRGARLLKRIENVMAEGDEFRELPSFFVECLAYNCLDTIFARSTWTDRLRGMLVHIWEQLQGEEPTNGRWVEANECFYLFYPSQDWSREDGRDFAKAAWNHFGFK